MTASTAQLINALNVAGSVAVAGGKVGVAVSGSGVYVRNAVDVETVAKIEGDLGTLPAGQYAISGDAITVDAETISRINVIAAAASVAFGFGATGVSVAIGASVSQNEIDGKTEALISAVDDGGVRASAGNVTVQAKDEARIYALTAAAALSAGFGKVGVAVSAAGALAFNKIGAQVTAQIDGSRVSTAVGDVIVDAQTVGEVGALIASAAVSIAAGAVGIGAGIGASYADNMIGHGYGNAATTYTSDQTLASGVLSKGNTVRVMDGIHAGRAFKYISDDALGPNQDTNRDLEITSADTVLLNEVDYGNPQQWEEIDVARTPVQVTAAITNSAASAISKPPPTAIPLTAQMTGFFRSGSSTKPPKPPSP